MKPYNKIITLVAGLASLTIATGNLHAGAGGGGGGGLPNVVTITATALVQNGSNTSGNIQTTSAPTKLTLDTKHLLAFLNLAKNGPMAPPFPAGAKLVGVSDSGSGVTFQVWDKNNGLIVDVADILTASMGGDYGSDVSSGKQNINTQLASPTNTDQQIFTLLYDDTGSGGSLQFYLTGLMTSTQTDTAPSGMAGTYKETQTNKGTSMTGDGNYQGNSLVITGGFTATASGTLTIVP